jgi:UDP-N-acetylglucosamine acyltransferase
MANFIHPTAILFEGKVILGDNIRIGAYCTIGGPPEHKEVDPNNPDEYGTVIIEDGADIRNQVNIDAGLKGSSTIIRKKAMIMAQAHIGHDAIIGEGVTVSSAAIVGGHSKICDFSNLGLNTTLHQFTEVGEGVMLGAGCFAKGKLDEWSIYHTKTKATNQGLNQHLLDKMGLHREKINK